jgi:hypothetical protein
MTCCKTLGQVAYERDRRAKPFYWDGRPRPPWDDLPDDEQTRWEGRA